MAGLKILGVVVLVIVAVIAIFSIIGNTAEPLRAGSRELTDANNCSEAEDANSVDHVYNWTDKFCYNQSTRTGLAGSYSLPLAGLFSESGVVFVIIFAGLLLFTLGWIFVKARKG